MGKEGYAIGQSGIRRTGGDLVGSTITQDDLVIGKVLGKGACGMVYEARIKSTNTLVALKTINVYDKERRHQLINDLRSLSDHKCPFLISFHGALYEEGQVRIALELMNIGSLSTLMKLALKDPEWSAGKPLIPEPVMSKIT